MQLSIAHIYSKILDGKEMQVSGQQHFLALHIYIKRNVHKKQHLWEQFQQANDCTEIVMELNKYNNY